MKGCAASDGGAGVTEGGATQLCPPAFILVWTRFECFTANKCARHDRTLSTYSEAKKVSLNVAASILSAQKRWQLCLFPTASMVPLLLSLPDKFLSKSQTLESCFQTRQKKEKPVIQPVPSGACFLDLNLRWNLWWTWGMVGTFNWLIFHCHSFKAPRTCATSNLLKPFAQFNSLLETKGFSGVF